MRTGAISDAQITASSIWDSSHEAYQGRLNFQAISLKSGSWSAGRNGLYQWLQVFFGGPLFTVTGVATQGRSDHDQWVTRYRLMYSDDGLRFQDYREVFFLVKVRKTAYLINAISLFAAASVVVVFVVLVWLRSQPKASENSSWCYSLRPLNAGVHHLNYGCMIVMNGPC